MTVSKEELENIKKEIHRIVNITHAVKKRLIKLNLYLCKLENSEVKPKSWLISLNTIGNVQECLLTIMQKKNLNEQVFSCLVKFREVK